MTDQTTKVTAGPQDAAPTEAELTRLARRKSIQTYINTYEDDPQQIFDAMVQFGVSAAEAADAMDYRMNFIDYMRANHATDGLGGLKVWPEQDIVNYIEWQARQPNVLRTGETIGQGWAARGITSPTTDRQLRLAAQREFDRAERRAAMNPNYKPEWK